MGEGGWAMAKSVGGVLIPILTMAGFWGICSCFLSLTLPIKSFFDNDFIHKSMILWCWMAEIVGTYMSGVYCLIWFWGSPWVACIRVWEQGHTCNGMAYKHTDTSTSIHNVYTSIHTRGVYTSIHTCRDTRHRASTDVTPQLPSDLLLPNLGSSLLLNQLHSCEAQQLLLLQLKRCAR